MIADLERYSRRSTTLQYEAQGKFMAALKKAGQASGQQRAIWHRQASGDGELAVLPADVDEGKLINQFLLALDADLRPYNDVRKAHARVRVRVAFHEGPVILGAANGFAGTAVNETARLVEAQPLKQALAAFDGAAVACVVSKGLFDQVVAEAFDGIRPKRFRRITVTMPDKGFEAYAWVSVIGEDVNAIDLSPQTHSPLPTTSPPAGPRLPDAGGIQTGDVTARRRSQVVIGHGASAVQATNPGEPAGDRGEQ